MRVSPKGGVLSNNCIMECDTLRQGRAAARIPGGIREGDELQSNLA
jgi:hypothetical protein